MYGVNYITAKLFSIARYNNKINTDKLKLIHYKRIFIYYFRLFSDITFEDDCIVGKFSLLSLIKKNKYSLSTLFCVDIALYNISDCFFFKL